MCASRYPRSRLNWTAAIFVVSLALTPQSAFAVVFHESAEGALTSQDGDMKYVGRLLYTPLQVFGGCAIWIGDRWVLTARHAVANWNPRLLTVELPNVSQRLAVQAVLLPEDEKIDLALLQIEKVPEFDSAPTFSAANEHAGERIWIGGFGNYGPPGTIQGSNKFHAGHNTIDRVGDKEGQFSLSPPTQGEPHEAIPARFDSGSPVFVEHDSKWSLVGIVVRVSHGESPNVGDRATYTRIVPQSDWMRGHMSAD